MVIFTPLLKKITFQVYEIKPQLSDLTPFSNLSKRCLEEEEEEKN